MLSTYSSSGASAGPSVPLPYSPSGHPVYTASTVSVHGVWHGLSAHSDSMVAPRTSHCDLEVDVWADDIWNPSMRNPHAAATAGASARVDAVVALPSLAALWEVRVCLSAMPLIPAAAEKCVCALHCAPCMLDAREQDERRRRQELSGGLASMTPMDTKRVNIGRPQDSTVDVSVRECGSTVCSPEAGGEGQH